MRSRRKSGRRSCSTARASVRTEPNARSTISPIVSVRSLPDESSVAIEGVLTTSLGSFDGGRGAFVQDATGGIALYLSAAPESSLAAGTLVRVSGTITNVR